MQALEASVPSNSDEAANTTGNPYIEPRNSTEPIPAIYSYSAIPREGQIGDNHEFILAGQPLTFQIRGILADFPTLASSYIIVNIESLKNIAGPSITGQLSSREAWIKTENADHTKLISDPAVKNAIIADADQNLIQVRNNILTLGTQQAFSLNAFVLSVLSLAGIVLANYFSLRQRAYEFSILKAFGLSQKQSNQMIIGEGTLMLGLGLLSGLLLGFSLTQLMRPYISLAVSRSLPDLIVHHIPIDWSIVASVTMLLILLFGVATAITIYLLWKSRLHQVLRMGDE